MKRATPIILAMAITAVAPLRVHSQSGTPEIRGVITGEAGIRIPIAVTPVTASREARIASIAVEIHQTLIDDLAYSGYFEIVDPARFNGFVPPASDSADLKPWRSIGAEAVLATKLLPQGKQIALEGRIFDLASSERVFGKRYAGEVDLARRVAHRLANEVIAHFTGQPGVALSRIAFVSKHNRGKELYVMDYDGRRVRRMTTSGTINLSPVWSPDGTRLAYLSYRQKFPAIFILEADGAVTRLPTGGGDLNSGPDWSHDGTRLAFSSTRDGNSEIYVMDNVNLRVGSRRRERRLTDDRSIDASPSWSPTGNEIAFTSDRTGNPQIFVMDADGSNVRRLTFEGKRNDSPAWSPKGDRIVYVSRVEGRFALMLFDLETRRSTTLLSGPFNCEDPRWSFDARHITFSSDKEGSYDIYAVDLDGSNLRRLTKGAAAYTPDWSR